ncbi:MFS transporter [Phycicoccus endophyticus]|uniref:MFS transporter n=1 Tax=Phycicoccus endophyticus TaxID=1690220 RepID=A0A7G9R0C7_9MICO|nr:MFS transporter [Phycicoccus endophyticus]NHI20136.1 MFS transporter [Phycicoccus endophyticus]QNN49052.1 MFS transporter [Phycicoccus endophyticus]GGL38104.1 MFS transporter [Phycicoccus endophyticus]
MSPIASYRRLFDLAGPGYVLVAFVGRLPLAMSQMGTLLLVADTTGSYGAAGAAAGALAVANAAGAPAAGALSDRVGQRPVVLVQSLAGGGGLLVLVALAVAGTPSPALLAAAAVAGLLLPQVGPLARVRWRPLTRHQGEQQPRLLETAFSYEGAADEASFVMGPALVGLLAVLASPALAVATAAVVLLGFGTAFALHPTAAVTHAHRPARLADGRVLTPVLGLLLLAQLLVGVLFGSVQAGTTVLTTLAGHAGLAGIVHATLGVGSVLAGLAVAGLPERFTVPSRVLAAATGLAVLSAPLLLVDTVGHLVLVVLALGFAVAPYMISVFVLGERAVPPSRVGAAMTLLAAVTGVGYALGSALAGRLADAHGHHAAFAVTVSATVGAALLALLAQPALRSVGRTTGP